MYKGDEHSNYPDCDEKEAAEYAQTRTAQTARKHGDSASRDFRGRAHLPGPGTVIEIQLINYSKAGILHAMLIYRFVPGELYEPDPEEVVLDRAKYVLGFSSMAPS